MAVESEELEDDIKLSGFFRQKTKAIKALSQTLVNDFGGEVPRSTEELLSLPGIGRKTAKRDLRIRDGDPVRNRY